MSHKPPNYHDPKACEDLKILHDSCFHKWLRDKFLPGTAKEAECQEEWKVYSACTQKKMEAFGLGHLIREKGEPSSLTLDKDLTPDEDTKPAPKY